MISNEFPLVTIGMPIKNRSWCLNKVLRSIENLVYPQEKIKLVFVDDFSTDGTYEIIAEWAEKMRETYYDITLIQKHTNIPQARNLCIKHMEGKYLLFWDSDVIPPSELLREMVEYVMCNKSIGIIGSDYAYEPWTGIKYKPITNKKTNAVYMGFTLIRREVFEAVGMFNENLSVGEDTEFSLRVVEQTSYKIVWAPKPVLHLKKSEEVKKKGLVRTWLMYNFYIRSEEYYKSFRNLPRFLKARVLYYLGLPWVAIISLVTVIMGLQVWIIMLLMYLIPSIYLVIRQKGLKDGMTEWLKFNVPTGLALSYGVLRVAVKRVFLASP